MLYFFYSHLNIISSLFFIHPKSITNNHKKITQKSFDVVQTQKSPINQTHKISPKTQKKRKKKKSFLATIHYVVTHKTIHMYYLNKLHDSLNKSYD